MTITNSSGVSIETKASVIIFSSRSSDIPNEKINSDNIYYQ